MIKQKVIFVLFFINYLTGLSAQNDVNQLDTDGKRHGLWTKTYEGTSIPRYSGRFIHGKEVDTFKYYKIKNNKPVLSALKVFNNDNNTAKVAFYASNGKVVSEGIMDGKHFIGKWMYYHNNSDALMIVEQYNDQGALDGERLVYYKNGNLAEKAQFKKGQLNGESLWYTEKGDTLRISNYVNDKLNGPSVYYEATGTLSAKGHYKDNLKTGIWLYYKNGILEKEINHSN